MHSHLMDKTPQILFCLTAEMDMELLLGFCVGGVWCLARTTHRVSRRAVDHYKQSTCFEQIPPKKSAGIRLFCTLIRA
jgi:hypothetical protein